MGHERVIRGGRVGAADAVFDADIAIADGRITALGRIEGQGAREIDASGRLVLPGGVDTHCHIEQISASGIRTADDFESATTAAVFGGTTTVISFAAQHRDDDLRQVVAAYHKAARRGATADYGFHLIVTRTDAATMEALPELIRAGHNSIKIFTTYEKLILGDEEVMDVLALARREDALVCVHAENNGMIAWATRDLLDRGLTAPKWQAESHPRASEIEALERVALMAGMLDQPVMIFHVSTAEGAAVIREARGRGLPVFAETCPHYLFLSKADLDRPGIEGGKWICSPPLRTEDDQQALWRAIRRRDLQVISSDHAPYAWDASGKLKAGPAPVFNQFASGMPGLEVRLPLMFDAMVSKGRAGISDFVDVTATTPARLYGLHPKKGTIAVGADADIVLWDPERHVTLTAPLMHDRTGYTPFEGVTVQGWPETVLRRGEIIVQDRRLAASAGSGQFLPRHGGSYLDARKEGGGAR